MRAKLRIIVGVCGLALSGFAGAVAAMQTQEVPPDFQREMEQAVKGTLAVRAVQGTKDGIPIGGEEVEIAFFHRNVAVKQITSKLDEHGVIIVSDLPAGIGLQPVVQIKHAGVLYRENAPAMDAEKKDVSIDITVHDVTETMPAWKIVMRHVIMERSEGALRVAETVVVENPTDRTWLGAPPNAQNRRTTVSLTLPPRATGVEIGAGFHGWCCTEYKDPRLDIQMPFMPGKYTYRFGYTVPVTGGVADVRLSAPAAIDRAAFFVAPDGSEIAPTVLQEATEGTAGAERMFQAMNVPSGQAFGLVLTSRVAPAATQPSVADEGSSVVPWVVGGGVVVVVAGVVVVRAARRKCAAPAQGA